MKKNVSIILLVIFILNIADTIFTIKSISNGYTYELNPIIRYLISKGNFVFIFTKIGLISVILLYTYLRINSNSYKHIYKVFIFIVIIMIVIVLFGFASFILPKIMYV